jgi:TetR/AcrR family transcriptional regulator, transcriptional repressor of bet genes
MPGRHETEAVRRSQIIKAACDVAAARGLDGLTVRRVATKAGVSTGLVLFHFRTKEHLVIALLDWLLDTTTELHVDADIARIPSPLDRLLALLQQEMNRLSSEPRRILLFFDFWARGIRHAGIRAKMRRELARYRDAFRPMAEEVLRSDPDRFEGVTAEGLSAVAVSCIKGCAVQSMIDSRHFDIAEYLAAAQSLVGQLAAATTHPT